MNTKTTTAMDIPEFTEGALRTEMKDYSLAMDRLLIRENVRLLHGAMGICSEGGEIMDAIKAHIMYGKPLDAVNLREELGDLFWYTVVMCDTLEMPLSEPMEYVIKKLKARYPEKFTEHHATNRNLQEERKVLES